jgi:hypothetical protein
VDPGRWQRSCLSLVGMLVRVFVPGLGSFLYVTGDLISLSLGVCRCVWGSFCMTPTFFY